MWAKMLTTAVLLIAGGLTAVCAGWSMAGLSSGMNVNEIMSPVSYEESQKAERYVRQELQDQLAATGEAVFLVGLQEKRQAFYRSCKQFPIFGRGWLRRCDNAFSVATTLV